MKTTGQIPKKTILRSKQKKPYRQMLVTWDYPFVGVCEAKETMPKDCTTKKIDNCVHRLYR
jgi:hypothetical protein